MKMFKPKFLINLEKCILWQYDKAQSLSTLITEKQKWYKQNVSEFIVNFFINIFNLKTANDFGLNIWGKILNFPRQIMLNKYQISATDSHETAGIEVNRLTFQTKIASGDDFTALSIVQGDKYTFVFSLQVGYGWRVTITDKNGATVVNQAYLNNSGSPQTYGITGYSAGSTGDTVTVVADYTPLNLSTEQYRFLLLGQVLKFKMNCTIPEVNRYLRLIFNEENNDNVYVTDNHNMTITYTIEPSSLSDEIRLLIENYDFLPAPAGVKVYTGLGNYFDIQISPSPANASVVFNINGQNYTSPDNKLTVNSGTVVGYTVSDVANGFETKTGTVTVTESAEISVTLETTLTITATPNTATIKLTLNGVEYTATGSITKTVTYGNTYSYEVSDSDYLTEIGNGTITGVKNIAVVLQENNINLEFEGTYSSSGGVATQKTVLINRAGTYKIELGGDNSYERSRKFANYKGGTAVLQTTFEEDDELEIKIMYGGYLSHSTGNAFGGVGVGVWLNGTCILVAGGAGAIGAYISGNFGGGGYIGGDTTGGSSSYQHKGYSADGTVGNNRTTNAGAGYAQTAYSEKGWGGSGYVASAYESIATLVYAGNETGKGYAKITYIEE